MTVRLAVLGLLFITAAVVAPGCGTSRGLVPVKGRVTFTGKSPPAAGHLFFTPRTMRASAKDQISDPRPGSARFLTDGSFRASTFRDGDGLRPGTYEVRIECFVSPEDDAKGPDADKPHFSDGRSLVPAGFQPPDITVPATSRRPVEVLIDVP